MFFLSDTNAKYLTLHLQAQFGQQGEEMWEKSVKKPHSVTTPIGFCNGQ